MRKKHIVLKLKAYLSLSKAAKRAKKARTSRKKGKKRRPLYQGFMYDTDDDNTSSSESGKNKRIIIPWPIKSNIEDHEQTCIGLILKNNERQQKIPTRRAERNNGQYEPAFLNRKQTDCDCTMRADMVAVMESKK